jgi:hypothetical protein
MSELKEKYIQFCCDFYNEHAPEDKLWFGRMFEQCQEDYEQQNRCMYRWQFPLMILKDRQAEIDQLKAELSLCREENKGLVGSLNEQRQINIALNSETIKQREQIQHYMGKCVEQNKQVEEGLKLIKSLYKSEFSQRSNPSIHISQIREIEKALRGEHESTN